MRCPKCGVSQPAGVKFCMECGARMPVQNDSAPNVPYQPPEAPAAGPSASAAPVRAPAAPAARAAAPAKPKMKWFHFLIHFSLWCAAVSNLALAVYQLTDGGYGEDAALIYEMLPGLHAISIIHAVFCLFLAIFCIYTRYRLARFRRNGPTCILLLQGAAVLIPFLFSLAEGLLVGAPLSECVSFFSLLVSLFLVYLNVIYFRKRAHLFIY